ncbi:hypothetical protein [Prevotella pallens]|uniref:hypothetical protein n=1 Tax=Prevotella pallens TaxID=60133 RepID=UPI0023F0DE32|nr:hypothetical protein [Prevotella pallens]
MNRSLRLAECSHPISWVHVECFAECSLRNWQTVSSRRGRFIAPAYRKIHTKWGTNMRIW